MSKRLIRINPVDAFAKLEKTADLEVNIVLNNDRTYFGKLVSINHDFLVISDQRSHLHRIALSDLYEIVYDQLRLV